jgi:type III pantothenate kinase
MLLVVDVGNTNIVLGVYQGEQLLRHWRLATTSERSSDEYGVLFEQFMAMAGIGLKDVTAAILSCVVPPVEWIIVHTLEEYFHLTPMIVGPGIKTGVRIMYDNPKEVGADRIVNAVAALARHPGPMILVDFGTATTFDAISSAGDYLGGAISTGITISMEALFRQASKLPRVNFAKPETVIGRSTVTSMQAGLFYGYVGLVDGIVERMAAELGGGEVRVIATGGLAKLIGPASKYIKEVDNLLTLEGLRILYERNR